MFKHLRKRPYRVAIEGFSDFERSALASFFRLAAHRVPAYVPVVTPDDSDFLVADADQSRVLDWIAREHRVQDTVFIGEQAPEHAVAWLTRPIEPIHIMRALDALLGARRHDSDVRDEEPEATAKAIEAQEAPPDAVRRQRTLPGGADRQVLVADHSAIARSFLAQRLRGFGYRVTLAPSGEEALANASQTTFAIAFVDLNLGAGDGIDGLQLCQALKLRINPPEGAAPSVVITGGHMGATDRVRAALAGCDACLAKPMMESDVLAVLHAVDPLFHDDGSNRTGDRR